MKRKILALILTCLVLVTLSISVSANETATITVGTVDVSNATEDTSGNKWVTIPVELDFIPAEFTANDDYADGSYGIRSIGLNVKFDNTALKVVNRKTVLKGTIPTRDEEVPKFDGLTSATGVTNANATGTFTISYASAGAGDDTYTETARGEETILLNLSFQLTGTAPEDGLGEVEITIDAINEQTVDADYVTTNIDISDKFTVVQGGVKFAPVVTETKVKTFSKRFLDAENTLYTVGIISEGTDYKAEGAVIKAGIKIDKAGVMVPYWTNNAPVSDGNGTSYYVVGLKGVTTETDITPESASKAVVTVGEKTYESAEVTAVTSDATDAATVVE